MSYEFYSFKTLRIFLDYTTYCDDRVNGLYCMYDTSRAVGRGRRIKGTGLPKNDAHLKKQEKAVFKIEIEVVGFCEGLEEYHPRAWLVMNKWYK